MEIRVAATTNNGLQLESAMVLTDSAKKTIENNKHVIDAWLKDNHVEHHVECVNKNNNMSVLVKNMQHVSSQEMHEIEIMHDRFLSFVDDLSRKETAKNKKKNDNKDMQFVKSILASIKNKDLPRCVALIGPAPEKLGEHVAFGTAFAMLSPDLLVDVLECYEQNN